MENPAEQPQGNGPMADGSANASTPHMEQPQGAPKMGENMGNGGATAPGANERRGMAALGYVGALCLIPLIFARESQFAQYHAKQGLVLAIIAFILNLASSIIWRIPFGGVLVMIAGIILLVVCIKGILKALNGEKYEIPVVSEYAAKIHF